MNKKKFCMGMVFCLVMFVFTGCGQKSESKQVSAEAFSSTIFAMDTVMEFTVYDREDILKKAEELVFELERKFSTTDEKSEIYELNHNGTAVVGSETQELLQLALALCGRTNGNLDISIYPVVHAWGFTTGEYQIPSETELRRLLVSVDYANIRMDEDGAVTLIPAMEVDLGSVAKGYTGDRLAGLLRENGVTSAILNLGGNVHTVGAKPDGSPWRIAVTDPDPAASDFAGVLEVIGKAVITSGGYERYFVENGIRYHHIIDPATGYPADNGFLSVTVVGDEGIVCDALSTALFVMGPEKAAQFWRESSDFEAVFITSEGISITEGLEKDFSPLGDYQNTKVTVLHHD